MKHEYLIASRRAMVIRIVEPAAVERRIVQERRPLSFRGDVVLRGSRRVDRYAVLAIPLCLGLVVGFGFLATWALESFLNALSFL